MTDEARIARLTQLAWRVWPDEVANRIVPIVHDADGGYVQLRGRRIGMLVAIHGHPHALDALEAALLVLAGEPDIRVLSAGAHVPTAAQVQASHDALHGQPPAWVETLAGEWEREVARYADDPDDRVQSRVQSVRRCAAELRARAKGET